MLESSRVLSHHPGSVELQSMIKCIEVVEPFGRVLVVCRGVIEPGRVILRRCVLVNREPFTMRLFEEEPRAIY